MQSVRWAMKTTIDIRQAGSKKKSKSDNVLTGWKPPDPATIKINVDACFSAKRLDGYIGRVMFEIILGIL